MSQGEPGSQHLGRISRHLVATDGAHKGGTPFLEGATEAIERQPSIMQEGANALQDLDVLRTVVPPTISAHWPQIPELLLPKAEHVLL
ncbi:hypothetical protein ASG32_31675 [Methylobacterium sp. Leaf361]|nr:hypothetical protein ASG32_31675 [Methylobacterium sp. Leaf361]